MQRKDEMARGINELRKMATIRSEALIEYNESFFDESDETNENQDSEEASLDDGPEGRPALWSVPACCIAPGEALLIGP